MLQRSNQCSGHFFLPVAAAAPRCVSCVHPALPHSITLLALRPWRISSGWLASLFQGNNLFSGINCHGFISAGKVQVLANFALCGLSDTDVTTTSPPFPSHCFPTENTTRQFLISLPPLALASPKKLGSLPLVAPPLQAPPGISS